MTIIALLVAASLAVSSQETQPPQPPAAQNDPVAQAYFLYMQARVLDDAGDLEGAIAACRKVLALQPGALGVRADIATLYARLGKASEALTEALQALKEDPTSRVAHRVLGFVQAALAESATDAARQANLLSEAIGHLEKALAGSTTDLAVRLALARLYVQTGQLQKAIPTLKAFLDERPDYADAVLLLAGAYEGVKDYRAAIALLEPFVATMPKASVILDHLGEAYFQLKRYKDAAAAWDRSLSGDRAGIDAIAVATKRDKARELAGK